MALQHIQQPEIEATVPPQYFPIYGPTSRPDKQRTALTQALQRHPFMTLLLTGFALYCLHSIWAANGYWGGAMIYHWRCEISAGLLVSLTAWLFRTFRHWGQARVRRAERRQEYAQELAAFLQQNSIPPAKPREFALEIDAWVSQAPAHIIEPDGTITELPDAQIAPDMLVLKFQLPSQKAA